MHKVAVLGGGHGARTMAADLALAGHSLTLYEMPEFKNDMRVIFETKCIRVEGKARRGTAVLHNVTDNIKEALKEAEVILIVVPAIAHLAFAKLLGPLIEDGMNIVLVPGTLGSLEFAEEIRRQGINKNITISELDTLPYATRITGPDSVHVFHKLPKFSVGVFCFIENRESTGPAARSLSRGGNRARRPGGRTFEL